MANITTVNFSSDLTNANADILEKISILFKSYQMAHTGQSKLTESVLSLEGMSGRKYRMLINNLIQLTDNARYLEMGSWKGSTSCSAFWGNKCRVTCIDNWPSEVPGEFFVDVKQEFLKNINTYISNDINSVTLVESDFRKVDFNSIGKHNIYLFDGPHEYLDQYDGVNLAIPALDDTFILIVDDWNWEPVRIGTFDAIFKNNLRLAANIQVRTTDDNTHPHVHSQYSDWHNGYFIGVVSKQ